MIIRPLQAAAGTALQPVTTWGELPEESKAHYRQRALDKQVSPCGSPLQLAACLACPVAQ